MSEIKIASFCPNCGKSFECGTAANGKCWCFSYPKVIIPDGAKKCFCPDCLANAIEQFYQTDILVHPRPNS